MLTGRARRVVRQGWSAERAVRRARQLLDAGRAVAAAQLLTRTVLVGQDPDTAAPGEELIRAAALYVQAGGANRDGGAQADPVPLAWAAYAHRAAHRLHTASPVPRLVQLAADTLAQALHRSGWFAEAAAARREMPAAGLGDGAVQRRLRLAADLYAAGRCAQAHQQVALVGSWLADPQAVIPAASATIAALFAMLESCHRHDEATAVAVRLHTKLLAFAERSDTAAWYQFANLPDGFAEHTSSHHAEQACARPDCPSTLGDTAFSARLYAALLSGHDPGTARPDGLLQALARRLTALPESDRQTAASAAGWAGYLCRCAVARAAQTTATTPPTAGADSAAAGTGQLSTSAGQQRAARQAIAVLTSTGEGTMAVTIRVRLAEHLHHDGRCQDALAEARTAMDEWQALQPGTDDRHLIHRIRVAALYDASHHHDEARKVFDQLDSTLLPDMTPMARWATVVEEARTATAAHARTHHPDHPCTDQWCRRALACAADLPHQVLLRTLLPLYQQGRSPQVLPALAEHLADWNPADSPPGTGLANLAALYALTAVTDPASQSADTVLGWARYACRAAKTLEPGQSPLWATAQAALLHALLVYDADDQPADAVTT
ncbi:tetratricopeptide repeat protein [Dactylosporangium sp. CA-139066]|uniref:tetratricopeptide repeat protein n=1 Tax=Dactylosporangium sp. CA-139066 TaxID=3239930 RepID=UPI003D91E55A